MMPRGPLPQSQAPQGYAGHGMAYPGPVMMFPQGIGMAMAMPQQMMDASGYAIGQPMIQGGGGRGRGGRYDNGRGRGGRGPSASSTQMPYA